MIASHMIERARVVRIEIELRRRGIKLQRVGNELIGPCPRCGGRDRFAISLRKQCFLCRGCGARGDVIELARFLDACSFAEAVTLLAGGEIERPQVAPPATNPKITNDAHEREMHRRAAWLWSRRQPIAGTPAERYLRERRKITLDPLPATLGFLPASGDYPPAMIAGFGIPEEPEPGIIIAPADVDAVHITRLLPDGTDRERGDGAKIMLGASLGRPIVIAPVNDLLGLAVAEGIEDALAIHQSTGLGAWAAGAAGRMPALAEIIPSYVECVTILMHPDPAGQRGAKQLATMLRARGSIEVIIRGLVHGQA